MLSLKELKYPLFLLGMVVIAVILKHQSVIIHELKTANHKANQEIISYQQANEGLLKQYQQISEALTHAAQQKVQAEQQSSQLRKQLKESLQGTVCADIAVPDAVIRLQREAIEATNTQARDTSSTITPVPAT